MRITMLLFCVLVFISCSYHFYDKNQVLKRVAKDKHIKYEHVIIVDSGRILKVLVRDSNYQHLDEIYQFDEKGKQLGYSLVASCDSCFEKYLSHRLAIKEFKWNKLNDSVYLSRRSLNRKLTIHRSEYSYDISKLNP